MKTTLLTISSCFILSILVVAGLFAWSRQKTRKDNGFYRLLPPHPVTRSSAIDLEYNSFYIAGTDKNSIYLSNYTAPLHLIRVALPNMDTTHIKLGVNDPNMRFRKNTRISILPPYFYVTDGVTPLFLRGKLNERQAVPFTDNNAYFIDAKPISDGSMVLQSISSKTNERVLGKKAHNSSNLELFPKILEKQIDGIFCTDGKLYYNKDLAQLIYVYNYRNQYIVMDTTLNVLHKWHTIDTISKARIKAASLYSGQTKSLASPPYLVNKTGATSGNYLYIQSNLMAKNESSKRFKKSAVIDLYNLENGTYSFSFYLDTYNGYRPSEFRIVDNTLIALHHHYLVLYNIDSKRFIDTTISLE